MEPYNPAEIIERISQYTGRQAIIRFRFLADNCLSLSLTAYELALQEIVQHTWDVTLYKAILAAYNKIAASNQIAVIAPDETWLEDTQTEINQTLCRLESDLKNSTTNLIKDSIRNAHRELGAHHRRVGDHNGALRAYTKAREYATSPLHVAELSLAIIDIAFEGGNYKLAQNYISKAEGAIEILMGCLSTEAKMSKPKNASGAMSSTSLSGTSPLDRSEKELQRWTERLRIASGLAALAQADFTKAAESFLHVSRDVGQNCGMEPLATASDLAIYGTLCSLASFNRHQLKEKVIENVEFRSLLETEPQLRNILNLFRDNKYKDVLRFLEDSLPSYKADIFLSVQIDRLLSRIQERAIVQYFIPFSSASLSKASDAFGWPMDVLQQRLIQSIESKTLAAKLDLTNGVLFAHRPDIRPVLFHQAMKSAEKMEHETKAALLRLRLIQAEVLVKDPSQPNSSNSDNPRGKFQNTGPRSSD